MTQAEFDAGHNGAHVPLTCENHPNLRWSCKKLALSKDSEGKWRYNGMRHLFFGGCVVEEFLDECECPASKLYAVIEG